MKISFISTVFNEEENMVSFIESISSQTKKPDEIVIVDGGSTDSTVKNIKYQISNIKYQKFKLLVMKGCNRAEGRNLAIKQATGDVILCSDAGCVLDKNWVKKIIKPFYGSKVDVVAGYYRGLAKNVFEKCLVPFVLVMPNNVNPKNFLPSSRSMAFKKSVWRKIGGFPENYSHNEDYVFAKKIKRNGFNIYFEKEAIANWVPRNNLKDAFVMFLRFAIGDAEARILRAKVFLIYLRYILGATLLLFFIFLRSSIIFTVLLFMIFLYLVWSIQKNFKYVKDLKAIFILPVLQITSDIAVIVGTGYGFLIQFIIKSLYEET